MPQGPLEMTNSRNFWKLMKGLHPVASRPQPYHWVSIPCQDYGDLYTANQQTSARVLSMYRNVCCAFWRLSLLQLLVWPWQCWNSVKFICFHKRKVRKCDVKVSFLKGAQVFLWKPWFTRIFYSPQSGLRWGRCLAIVQVSSNVYNKTCGVTPNAMRLPFDRRPHLITFS